MMQNIQILTILTAPSIQHQGVRLNIIIMSPRDWRCEIELTMICKFSYKNSKSSTKYIVTDPELRDQVPYLL